MRLVLCGGGTGGHVYPLLAVRAALPESGPAMQYLFIGGSGIERELVARESVPYHAISGGGLHGVGLRSAAPNALKLAVGFVQALGVLRRFRPQALLATGGFITVPVALAAVCLRIPRAVFLPDIEPALSVRFLGWLADRVMATVELSRQYFGAGKFVATGYPLRRELLQMAGTPQAEARALFGIRSDSRVVLVFGGSRGARNLNRALLANIERLLPLAEFIHISGQGEWDEVRTARERLPEALRARYHIYPYLHAEMGAALRAADLAVSRSGASTLGELPLFGLPGILVPYPYAWRYQKVNADFLAGRGAAVIVRDEEAASLLAPAIERLLQDDVERARMGAAARALARPDAAQAIGRAWLELAGDSRRINQQR